MGICKSAILVLLQQASANGIAIRLTPQGTIRINGHPDATAVWAPILRSRKPEVLAALSAGWTFDKGFAVHGNSGDRKSDEAGFTDLGKLIDALDETPFVSWLDRARRGERAQHAVIAVNDFLGRF